MSIHHANCAETTLAAAITTTGETSITVTSEAGFPAVDFIISIGSEVMLVTNVSTTTWTVTRGYEGSTAATHLNGASVFHDISAAEADVISSITAAGLALIDDANAAAQLVTLGALPLAGGTLTGKLIMDNMDVTLVKLLTLHGEIDDGNSSTADTIDWNTGTAHKSTLTGNVTYAFTGYGLDLCSGGTITASDYMNAGMIPAQAADDNGATAWLSNTMPAWWKYQLAAAKTVTTYSLRTYYDSANFLLRNWTLQGSNNGTDWTTVDTVSDGFSSGESNTKKYFVVDTPGSYLYYKINITAATGGAVTSVAITEIELIDSAITDPAAPCFLTMKLVQDGTGGRTVTWPATVKGTPAINLAASSTSNILFYWDGTNYYVLNGLQYVSATDKILGRSTAGAGAIEEIACTAAGRALLDDAAASNQLTTLGALPLAGGTMSGDITLGENTAVALDPEGSADEKWSGITVSGTAGATLAVGDLCYLNSSFKWVLADADAASTSGSVALGLCILAAAGDNSATNMLLVGTMRSAAFPASITGGAQLYVSATAGDMTTTIPTGADVVVRVVGWAILTEPNTIYFSPSSDYITRVS